MLLEETFHGGCMAQPYSGAFINGEDNPLTPCDRDAQLHQLSYPGFSHNQWTQEPLTWADGPLHYVSNCTPEEK